MSNTAQRLKSRGTSFLRQVKDIGNIAVSSFDDIKMSMAKATNQDPVPPKEKHVKKLILATETNRELNMVEFAKAICRIYRKSSDWLTASKGLQLLHRIVQEGSTEFCDAIVQNDPEKRFNMSKFKDRHTSEAMDQSPLVKQYCRYLEERLILYRIYQLKSLLPDMTLDAYVSSNDMKGWLDLTESLLRTTNELLECYEIVKGKKSILENGAAVGCFTLCLDDSFVLYKLLSDCATKILDDFYKIPLTLAKRGLEVYEKYCDSAKRLESMFEFSKNVNQIFLKSKPPSLKFKPESVLEPMREYVESQGGTKRRLIDHGEVPTTDLSSILSKNELEMIKLSTANEEDTTSSTSKPRSSSVKKNPFGLDEPPKQTPKTSPRRGSTNTNTATTSTSNNNAPVSLDDLLSFDTPQANNQQPANNGNAFNNNINQPNRQNVTQNILSQFDNNNMYYGGNNYGGYGGVNNQYGGVGFSNNPYGNNPYGNNPYQNNPYANNSMPSYNNNMPYANNPYQNNPYANNNMQYPNNNTNPYSQPPRGNNTGNNFY